MKNPLVKREPEKGKEVALQSSGDPFVDMVERIATNADIDADKLQKVLDVQMQVMDRQARDEFYRAMNRVQAELPMVARDAINTQTSSKYARLETISRALKPVYSKHGFSCSFTQDKADLENHIRVRGTLRHAAGHSESHYYVDVPLDDRGIKGSVNKTPTHATGSSFAYGRRYLTCMMFDIATGDDVDGNPVDDSPLDGALKGRIADMLKQLSPEENVTFWQLARCDEGDFDGLKASRTPAYLKWLEKHGAA